MRIGQIRYGCHRCAQTFLVAVDVYLDPDSSEFYAKFDEADVWLHQWTHDAEMAEMEAEDE